MLNGSVEYIGELPAQRLERMKREFLVAQQRHRHEVPDTATRPPGSDDGPLLAGPDAEQLTIAAVRP